MQDFACGEIRKREPFSPHLRVSLSPIRPGVVWQNKSQLFILVKGKELVRSVDRSRLSVVKEMREDADSTMIWSFGH